MKDKKLKALELQLAEKYDKHCHDYKKNMGYTIYLKEPLKFGENVKPGELNYFDTDALEIYGFYTWKGCIILTDGCGDGDMDHMLSDTEAKKFLDYISDEKNLKFEH